MKILFKNYFTISAEFYEDSDIKMDNSMFCTILKKRGLSWYFAYLLQETFFS